MANVNPGPAVTSTPSTVATLTPVNTLGPTVPGQAGNALRLLCEARAVPLSGTGDIVTLPIINASLWVAATIVFSNALVNGVTGTVAAANVGIFTAAAAGGTVVRTAGVLTGMTGQTIVLVNTAASAAVSSSVQTLFLNGTVAVAGGTVDVFVYGYDIS